MELIYRKGVAHIRITTFVEIDRRCLPKDKKRAEYVVNLMGEYAIEDCHKYCFDYRSIDPSGLYVDIEEPSIEGKFSFTNENLVIFIETLIPTRLLSDNYEVAQKQTNKYASYCINWAIEEGLLDLSSIMPDEMTNEELDLLNRYYDLDQSTSSVVTTSTILTMNGKSTLS